MALLRTLLSIALMLVVYGLAPLGGASDRRLGLWLALALVAVGAAVGWQIRAISVSPTPRLRAVETVAVALPFLLLLFSAAYSLMSRDDPASFTEELTRIDALYFTMTVFATVGFGDIAPVAEQARIVTMVQMVVGLLAIGVVARLLLGAVQHAIATRESVAREGDTPGSASSTSARDEQPQA